MNTRFRGTLLILTITLMLAVSAMWTVPARAEDATPPPAATPSVVQPSEASSNSETSLVEAPIEPSVLAPREEMTAHSLATLPHQTNVVELGRSVIEIR